MIKIIDIDSTDFIDRDGAFISIWSLPDQNDVAASFFAEMEIVGRKGHHTFFGSILTGKYTEYATDKDFSFEMFRSEAVYRAISNYILSCDRGDPKQTIFLLCKKLKWEYNFDDEF